MKDFVKWEKGDYKCLENSLRTEQRDKPLESEFTTEAEESSFSLLICGYCLCHAFFSSEKCCEAVAFLLIG